MHRTTSSPAQPLANLTASERLALLKQLLQQKANVEPATHPLSPGQQAFWFLYQNAPGSAAYNVPFAARIRSRAVDVAALQKACDQLVERHPMLRCTYATHEGNPQQQLHAFLAPAFNQVDASEWSDEELAAEVKRTYRQPFDLENGPVVRITLFRRAADYVLLFVMHHISVDAWSLMLLVEDLKGLYAAVKGGQPAALPPLPATYFDYGRNQQQLLEGDKGEQLAAYWAGQLAGACPALELPADRPRPARQTHNGDSCYLTLDAALTAQLRDFSRREGVTLYMTLLAAFQVLLHRYSGQPDVLVGSPIAGRSQPEYQRVVGYFVNMVALRAQLGDNPGFNAFLQQVRGTVLGAMQHHQYPFAAVVKRLQLARDPARSPLFQATFNLVRPQTSEAPAGPDQLVLEPFEMGQQEGQFDLTLELIEGKNALEGAVKFNTDLFDKATVERMSRHYRNLLAAILDNPARPVRQLPLLGADEYRQVTEGFNPAPTAYPADKTIHELFESQVSRSPDAAAVVFEEKTLTYRQLNERANQLAHCLRRHYGIQPDDRIGLLVDRSEEMLVGILGILKAGAAYVPIDPAYPRDRVAYILNDSRVRVLLTGAGCTTERNETPVLDLTDEAVAAGPVTNPPLVNTSGDLCYVIYTSGTTGQPKGVLVEHRSVVNLTEWLGGLIYKNHPGPLTALLTASFNFDASVQQLFAPLLNGSRLVCISEATKRDPAQYVAALLRHQVGVVDITPAYLKIILSWLKQEAAGPALQKHLRYTLCGGETLTGELAAAYREVVGDSKLVNVYGITEVTVDSTFEVVTPERPSEASIGKPLPNTRLYILDAHLQPVPVGVVGEIALGGDGLARGYLNQPELTAGKFVANPFGPGGRLYRSGDLARWLPDGNVEFIGRRDHQVKVRGYRIELGEVENVLKKHPSVKEAVVAATGAGGEKQLAAYFSGHQQVSVAALRAFAQASLPEYMIPSRWVAVEAFPLTVNGKIDRQALPDPVRAAGDAPATYQAPRTQTEATLVEIWQKVLGHAPIGVHDNFFETGGDSIRVIQVVAQVHKQLLVKVEIKHVFAHPTVAGLAALVQSLGQRAYQSIQALSAQPDYEVSNVQRRLWILNKIEGPQLAYNMTGAFRLRGPLQRAALERAFSTLVERHESLRTTFTAVDGEPKQRVHEAGAWPLRVTCHDLRGETDPGAAVQRVVEAETATAFDVEKGPLLRVRLLHTHEHEHVLLVAMHHIISDGWSVGVLIGEVIQLYGAYVQGYKNPLAPLRVQYKEYAAWQNELLTTDDARVSEQFWLDQFADGIPVLELPGDFSRPARKTYRGDSIRFSVPPELTRQLRSLSRGQGATLFMTLLASVKALLYQYTGQRDIVVGSPVAGRDHDELDHQIGCYLNTLPLRTRFEGSDSFEGLLAKVKGTTLAAYEHQNYPFERLIELLSVPRDMSRSPLFDVMVVLQNTPRESGLGMEALELDRYPVPTRVSKFDWLLDFNESGEGLDVNLEYNTDLFSPARMAQMVAHYCTLLASVAQHAGAPLHGLAYLTEGETRTLLHAFNATRAEYPVQATLGELLAAQAARTPDAIAVAYEEKTLTYRQLHEKSNQLAHYLRNQGGVGPDQLVGLMVERSEWMLIAVLGVLQSGAAYLPLDPAFPAQRLQYQLEDSQARLVLVQRALREKLPAPGTASVVYLDELPLEDCPVHPPAVVNRPADTAYVLYTSGSTGQPKGVAVSHRNVVNFLGSMAGEPGLTSADTWLSVTTYSFDISVLELLLPLLTGARVHIAGAAALQDPYRLARLLTDARATVMQATPSLWSLLVNSGWAGRQGLKALCGGERLPRELGVKLLGLTGSLWNMYGPTETTVWSSVQRVTTPDDVASIGRPIANTQLYVLNEGRALVPVGVTGEIYIGGDGVTKGYLNRPALTAERFIPNPFAPAERLYRTGDLGRWLPEGRLEFLGRKDEQVKVRGYRIEPGEIENNLMTHPAVREAAVLAQPEGTPEGALVLVAYLVAEAGLSATDLRTHLQARLPKYMIPARFVQLDALPQTANGKTDRKRLPALAGKLLAGSKPAGEAGSPGELTATQARVMAIWREVLKRENLSPADDFFELGGHSLNGTQVVNRIEKAFGVSLSFDDLLEYGTVRQLAAHLDGLCGQPQNRGYAAIAPVGEQADYPVSHGQKRLWLTDQLQPGNVAYNLPCAFVLEKALDQAAFTGAFQTLVARHESLRTVFTTREGQPRQVIRPAGASGFRVDFTDLQADPEGEEKARLMAQVEAATPFNLAGGPLVRARLIRVGPEKYVFLFTLHHIIADGWTMGVLLQEVLALYEAFSRGEANPLPPLPIQYKDYAAWQHAQLAGAGANAHEQYWLAQFAGEVPVLDLPTDHPRPAVKTYRGDHLDFSLDPAFTAQLRQFSQAQGVSVFMTLLASVYALLYRYTGQGDLVIGSPIAGRDHADLENQIGLFVNLLALRTRLEADETFRSLLGKVKTTALGAYQHQVYPFDLLVEKLDAGHDRGRSPLTDVWVQLRDGTEPLYREWMDSSIQADPHQSKVDLTFEFVNGGDAIQAHLHYNTDLFERTTIEALRENLLHLLRTVLADPAAAIAGVALRHTQEEEAESSLFLKSMFDLC